VSTVLFRALEGELRVEHTDTRRQGGNVSHTLVVTTPMNTRTAGEMLVILAREVVSQNSVRERMDARLTEQELDSAMRTVLRHSFANVCNSFLKLRGG
jgi:hypothetical protein